MIAKIKNAYLRRFVLILTLTIGIPFAIAFSLFCIVGNMILKACHSAYEEFMYQIKEGMGFWYATIGSAISAWKGAN